MTAESARIGGDSDYDRAVVLAGAMGVRVVETTQAWLLERYSCNASAALITRSARGVNLRGISNTGERDDLKPGESRVFLAERRHGDALAVLHELGHAALHADKGRAKHRRYLERGEIIHQEIEAWQWAIKRMGRDLTPAERQSITICLYNYGAHMREIRTHVLPKITL